MLSTVTDPVCGAVATGSRPTRIAVERSGDGARFSVLDQGLYLAPRPVSAPLRAPDGGTPHLRVALIGIHMMLLGGDDIRIELNVGPGVTLEVIEPAGMVAYDAEGVASRWSLDAVLGEDSALVWDGAPFVIAGGADVFRQTRVRMGAGARVLIRETLVLGRSGEAGGALRSVTRLTGPGGDFLYEDLDLTGVRRQAIGVLGTSKVLSSATAAGWRPAPVQGPGHRPGAGTGLDPSACPGQNTGPGNPAPAAHLFELAADGAVLRALTDSAHQADRLVQPEYVRWKDQLTE
ncbi:urease accessory protein UreD [Arthrobacter sp. Helios]|uniref:urease accessory protein UreD n=1 Tax=Arthrobacter sp. Helios TaxID=2828862 RepID=UPI00204E516B|nr:urease accessory protein UreD [Arthrobacter sp. Helios]UPO77479.1 urease accessory protein UreD [Arthrobacter sp. Helios]